MSDEFSIALQRVLPQRALSTAMHHFMTSRIAWLRRAQIGVFTRAFTLDMAEAVEPDISRYASFNALFTRALKDGARPLASDPRALLSPADGTIGACGNVEGGMALQAKGRRYSVQALLGGGAQEAAAFDGGAFATVYLAPYNYHRVHMPLAGDLVASRYVPGRLFNVRPATVRGLDNLYARNERTVSVFDTEFGRLAVVMVGALFVGSVSHSWCGQVMPPRRSQGDGVQDITQAGVSIARGAELGLFNMGSTVVLLLERAGWREARFGLEAGSVVRVGEALATLAPTD